MKVKSKVRPYVKILKEDYDWDWYYVLPLLRKKLERMANYFDKSRLVEGWEDDVKNIRLCMKLIDIVTGKHEYYNVWTDTYNGYINIRNTERFGIRKELVDSSNSKTSGLFRNELRVEKAWHLLWRLIELKMRNWWD